MLYATASPWFGQTFLIYLTAGEAACAIALSGSPRIVLNLFRFIMDRMRFAWLVLRRDKGGQATRNILLKSLTLDEELTYVKSAAS